MPAKNAASWPAPIAKIARPNGVACRTTAKPAASTPKNAIEYGMCVPAIGGDSDVREVSRKAADRVGRQDPLRDPAVERQRSDRHRQGRQSDARHEEAVEGAEDHAEGDGRDHRRPDRPAVLEQLCHENPGEAEHRCDGEIDLSGDDDQRQRERHDRDLPDVQADVEEVRRLQEVGRDVGAVRDRAGEQDEQERFPADNGSDRLPPRRLAPGFVARLVVVDLSHEASFGCAGPARRERRSTGRRRSPR